MGRSYLTLRLLLWVSLTIATVLARSTQQGASCLRSSDCSGPDQICTEFGTCDCRPGTMLFAGDCVGARRHSEKCNRQIECSMSGDPNLQCIEVPAPGPSASGETTGHCRCRKGTVWSSKACRPVVGKQGEYDNVHHVGDFFDHKKVEVGVEEDGVVSGGGVFGPLLVLGSAAFLLLVCCCFCSVDPHAPHSIPRGRKSKESPEQSLPPAKTGQLNKGFERDDLSRSSKRTVTTEVEEEEQHRGTRIKDKQSRKLKRSKSKSNTSKSPSSAKSVDRKKKKHRKSAKRQLTVAAPGLNTDNGGDLQQMSNDAVKRNVEHLMKLASAQDVNETAQHDIDDQSHVVISARENETVANAAHPESPVRNPGRRVIERVDSGETTSLDTTSLATTANTMNCNKKERLC